MNKKIKFTIDSKDENGNLVSKKIEIDALSNYERFVELQGLGTILNGKGVKLAGILKECSSEMIEPSDLDVVCFLNARQYYIIKCLLYFAMVNDIKWYLHSKDIDDDFTSFINVDLGKPRNVFTRKLSPADVSRALEDIERVFKSEMQIFPARVLYNLSNYNYMFTSPFSDDDLDEYPIAVINLIRELTGMNTFVTGEDVIRACRDILNVEDNYRKHQQYKRRFRTLAAATITATATVLSATGVGLFKAGKKVAKLIKGGK